MKVTAAVYRQETPVVTRPQRHFFGEDGRRYVEHVANLIHVGDVTGSYDECWQQAHSMCAHPVLEFPQSMYRNRKEL